MRVAIFGTGGAGGFFGARLAQIGEEVVFLARGEHLEAIRQRGLRVETDTGDILIEPATATNDPAAVGPVDVVLLGVKTWQVTETAEQMRPLLGQNTFVVPLQNGVEAASQLAAVLGRDQIVGGLCGTFSWVAGPGHIRSLGHINFIKFGELDNRQSDRCELFKQAFERAGVNAEIPPNIEVALWEKLLLVAGHGGVGAVAQAPIGVVRALPQTRSMIEQSMREILAVAQARGVRLADESVPKAMGFVDRATPNATTSLARDITAGKPSELEAWTGAVVRLGKEAGVPTPLNEFIYAALLPREMKARDQLNTDKT
jgi:2-dehydropantoate 2-reductase